MLILTMAFACNEFGVNDLTPDPPTEACNGRDDDHDGAIDEGFADVDADGVADCVDRACELTESVGEPVEVDETCFEDASVPVIGDPWELGIAWAIPTASDVLGGPVAGRFPGDVAVVAFLTRDGVLHVVAGDGGELWQRSGFEPASALALADIDADGEVDLAAIETSQRVTLLSAAGDVLWRSEPVVAPSSWKFLAVADLSGDGTPDVIADNVVLDGRSGAMTARLGGSSVVVRAPTAGDLDGDGAQEVVLGDKVYRSDGRVAWAMSELRGCGFAAIADADSDGDPEVLVVTAEDLRVYDGLGAELVRALTPNAGCGRPVVADFDADGQPEVGIGSDDGVAVLGFDGAVVWSMALPAASGGGGGSACSGFDVDGDGASELLCSTRAGFAIFDGPTGAIRYQTDGRSQVTVPIVADVDGDGSADVVVSTASETADETAGIVVLANPVGWPPAGPSWPVDDFAVTNLAPDGGVPRHPRPWAVDNGVRSRPPADPVPLADLTVAITGTCAASCEADGAGLLGFEVTNRGVRDAHDVRVAAWRVDDDMPTRLTDDVEIPEVLSGARVTGTLALGRDGLGAPLELRVEMAAGDAACRAGPAVATLAEPICR